MCSTLKALAMLSCVRAFGDSEAGFYGLRFVVHKGTEGLEPWLPLFIFWESLDRI